MDVFVETERLVLRHFTEVDADNLVELDGDSEVMRFINGGRPTQRDEVESDVLPAFPPGEVELGYRLRRSAWGRGYATEGSRALIQKAFADLSVERVFATTMAVNVASHRVMEKAGLRYIRTFHQPWPDYIEGEDEGDVEYALLRSEWEQREN